MVCILVLVTPTQTLRQGLGYKCFIREVILRSTLRTCRSEMERLSKGGLRRATTGSPWRSVPGELRDGGQTCSELLWKGKDRRHQPPTGWSEMAGNLSRVPRGYGLDIDFICY